MASNQGVSYQHIAAGQATTVVKNSPGTIYGIIFNTAATATNVTTIYDNASGSGTVIGSVSSVTATGTALAAYVPWEIAISTAARSGKNTR